MTATTTTTPAPLLRVRAVDKAFGARRAVVGASFEVAAGEVVLVVGRNGAGKTTLLRIVTGFIDADAGEVAIDGVAIAGTGPRARARAQARIGYLPEHAPAASELAVGEHLRARARTKRVPRANIAGEVARVIAAAELAEVARQRIATLSKGFRQRVGLADALLASPPLYILDEPTSGMDPVQVRQLRELIAGAVVDGAHAAVISSHAVADLEPIATRVIVMRDGAIVRDATPSDLRGGGPLEAAVVALLGEARVS